MSARPIVPGYLYHVVCASARMDLTVIAPHGCDAICYVMSLLISRAD